MGGVSVPVALGLAQLLGGDVRQVAAHAQQVRQSELSITQVCLPLA
jgi:hypothetical protein